MIISDFLFVFLFSVAKPLLYPFEEFSNNNYKSANLVEGERLSLRCAIIDGYAYGENIRINWYKYDEQDEATDDNLSEIKTDERIEIKEETNQTTLIIDPVEAKDRCFYVCKATNDITSFNNTILLRIKGLETFFPIHFFSKFIQIIFHLFFLR